jgi:hypothetical protein
VAGAVLRDRVSAALDYVIVVLFAGRLSKGIEARHRQSAEEVYLIQIFG